MFRLTTPLVTAAGAVVIDFPPLEVPDCTVNAAA